LVGLVTTVTSARAGVIAPIVKEVTERLSLVLFELSVTVMVQLSWVPSARGLLELKVIVLLEVVAEVVELLQFPAYAMVPASEELKV